MSEFNKDELEPPSWMNEAFFEEVLSTTEGDNTIKVTKLEITPGTGKGDHYASIMFRARINYESKVLKSRSISLIIKTMPETECHKTEMFGDVPLFEVEIEMYSRIIPMFESELRKIGDRTVLGGRMIYSSLKPRKCIIFEDLVERGYAPLRGRLLDLTEAKAAFLKLAKWHAVSYKLIAEDNISVKASKGSFFESNEIEMLPMVSLGMPNLIKVVETIDSLREYVPKLNNIPKDYVKRFMNSTVKSKSNADSFINVICHGDFHSRNMMFKYHSDQQLDDVMLIDFQVSFVGPAVMDLLYGLYLLVGDKVRINHREELIYYYATNFIDTLKQMNFKGKCPHISDFFIDIIRFRHWELFLLSSFLPVVYVVIDGSVEIEEVIQSDKSYGKIYRNPVYISELKAILPRLCHMGYLE